MKDRIINSLKLSKSNTLGLRLSIREKSVSYSFFLKSSLEPCFWGEFDLQKAEVNHSVIISRSYNILKEVTRIELEFPEFVHVTHSYKRI